MNLVWFRRDLRTIDNTALLKALQNNEPVLAVYIATPKQWASHDLAPIQADLIARRLTQLQAQLKALNIPLLYKEVDDYSQCEQVIKALVTQYNVQNVMVNKDYEVNEIQRDNAVESALKNTSALWHAFDDKCAQIPKTVLNQKGEYYKVFTPFKKAWLAQFSHPLVHAPVKAPVNSLNIQTDQLWHAETTFNYATKSSQNWAVDDDSILDKLSEFCADDVNRYEQERDFPSLNATSGLSAYLAIGALSVRQCIASLYWHQSDDLSKGAQIWLSELIWRDFYQHLLVFEPKLSKGKPFVEWTNNIVWDNDTDYLLKWQQGLTGIPIIDAAMKQLNQTGWMHNRLRMVVASFLTKDLHCDWRLGEAYFMSQLIDGDFAANNGGWQWSASTGCDGQPYFRIFNPMSQSEKFDSNAEFIRQWLPELESVPNKYIHQPWLWEPSAMLDYPQPIIDHKVERVIALENYKQAKG